MPRQKSLAGIRPAPGRTQHRRPPVSPPRPAAPPASASPPRPFRLVLGFSLLLGCAVAPADDPRPPENPGGESNGVKKTSLDRYVARPQPRYAWSVDDRNQTPGLTRLDVTLTSQEWQGTVWTHAVRLFRPDDLRHRDTAILFVNGGANGRTPGADIDAACISLAALSGMPVVALFQVPNQPLLGDRYEDALIAETWLRYLDSEDETWPLLFPMVNSAVKAMDCVGELARQEFGGPIDRFVITGASKRGWTSWLTAAADPRIIGTAPMVIDTLNFRVQMHDQQATWGFFSEQIADYTRAGLIRLDGESVPERKLRLMMDPHAYRERLTVPKLMVHGTNDRYWRVDALKNYWDDLSQPKNVLNIPNAGHSLGGGQLQVIETVAAFAQHCADGAAMPQITWQHECDTETRQLRLRVAADRPPLRTSFWVAFAPTRDFREAHWERRSDRGPSAEPLEFRVDVPPQHYVAAFAEFRFPAEQERNAFRVSTGVVQPDWAEE